MTKLLEKTNIYLSNNESTAAALSQLEQLLEDKDYSGRSIAFVLGKLVLTHGHMARLKTLATKYNFEIQVICTSAAQTQLAALNLGLTVSEKAPGEEILEGFKSSFSNINSKFAEVHDQRPVDSLEVVHYQEEVENSYAQEQTQEEYYEVDQQQELADHYSVQEQNVEEVQLNQTEETVEGPISSIENDYDDETSEETCINDVIEVENKDEVIEQQQIELPFEDKNDYLRAKKPDILKPKEEMTVMYIHQTLRSGQVIAHDGHVVIAGDTHPGSEIVAGGDIIVWGTLGGIAHAGAGGNYQASIRALKMNAIQIRIADYIARRPDFKVNFSKEVSIKPEVARISNGEIKIFSLK